LETQHFDANLLAPGGHTNFNRLKGAVDSIFGATNVKKAKPPPLRDDFNVGIVKCHFRDQNTKLNRPSQAASKMTASTQICDKTRGLATGAIGETLKVKLSNVQSLFKMLVRSLTKMGILIHPDQNRRF
jgi:hypothetical protein